MFESSAAGWTCHECGTEAFGAGGSARVARHAFDSTDSRAVRVGTVRIRRYSRRLLRPRRRSPLVIAGFALALAAVAGVTALWLVERSAHHRDQRAARVQIDSLQTSLRDARVHSRSQAVSARQATLLAQAAVVLGRVDPLLLTARGQAAATDWSRSSGWDTFSADANVLVNDMILRNDLVVAANASGLDISYLNTEIDSVNTRNLQRALGGIRAVSD